jgi:ribosome-binding protein aMBF1 (putative translation factor)
MTQLQTILVDGKPYVLLPREDYERLTRLAKAADLPAAAAAGAEGEAVIDTITRAGLARRIIRGRADAGLSQRELAKLAGISFEHLCRIETGKHTPGLATIEKIERALKKAARPAKRTGKKGK